MNPDKNDFTMLDRLIRFNIVFHPERLGIYMDKVKAALTPKQFKVIFNGEHQIPVELKSKETLVQIGTVECRYNAVQYGKILH